jgi:aminoglycoside phosphotransferase (APT) family kinase protein
MSADIATALAALAPRFYPGATGISGLKRLTGGASQETWRFEVAAPGAAESLILRRRAGLEASPAGNAVTLAMEAALLQEAARRGVPVPPVRHVCAGTDGLGEAIVVGFVDGETLGRRIVAGDAFAGVRAGLAAQCGAALAGIHRMDPGPLPLPRLDARQTLAHYEAVFRRANACRPVLELAFRVLAQRVPPPAHLAVVHGDFRTGNLMVDPARGLVSVLDWELAHLGDPAEDLGWLCVNSWRFGAVAHEAGGFGKLADVLAAYQASGGRSVDVPRVRFWQALGSLKWAVMCLMMYDIFRSGADPSLERAAIGRRVSECEADLLALLEKSE